MTKPRLAKQDWISEGLRALATSGYGALRAEALARDLKTTKGSFYWHFKDLQDFKRQLLSHWQDRQTELIISELASLPSGIDRLCALTLRAEDAGRAPGAAAAELAIREWARHDDDAAESVAVVDARRLAYLAEQFADVGSADDRYASALYGAYLGLQSLSATERAHRQGVLEFVLSMLLERAGASGGKPLD